MSMLTAGIQYLFYWKLVKVKGVVINGANDIKLCCFNDITNAANTDAVGHRKLSNFIISFFRLSTL